MSEEDRYIDIYREREREIVRKSEREMLNMVALFLKGMSGALAPFSYLVI